MQPPDPQKSQAPKSQKIDLNINTNEGPIQAVNAAHDAFVAGGNLTVIHSAQVNRSRNEQLLLKRVANEMSSLARQSLHNAVYINLGKNSSPTQVVLPWNAEVTLENAEVEELSSKTTIFELFERPEISGKILILGNPGVGKTTTLIELAQTLIDRAAKDNSQPIPVLLKCSAWKGQQTIADWVVLELKSKYGFPKHIGKAWLRDRKILPMLDALDELPVKLQEPCIQATNKFLKSVEGPLSLILCCRSQEYKQIGTKLNLNIAIYLKELSNSQIQNYLAQLNRNDLWSFIRLSPELFELAKIPLFLNIAILTYEKSSSIDVQLLNVVQKPKQTLLDCYVDKMLERTNRTTLRLTKKNCYHNREKRWLGWLAHSLKQTSNSTFLIENIQPTVLYRQDQYYQYQLLIVLLTMVTAGIIGLICSLVTLLSLELPTSVLSGLVIGVWGALQSEIRLVETFSWSWSWSKILKYNLLGGLAGLLLAAVIRLLAPLFGMSLSVAVLYYPLAIVSGMFCFVASGFFQASAAVHNIEDKVVANQGVWKSMKNALLYTCLFIPVCGLLLQLTYRGVLYYFLPQSPLISFVFLFAGGLAVIQHISLRLVLYGYGMTPWNYPAFLNDVRIRKFLQRIGGRYQFIHALLANHFQEMSHLGKNRQAPKKRAQILAISLVGLLFLLTISSFMLPSFISTERIISLKHDSMNPILQRNDHIVYVSTNYSSRKLSKGAIVFIQPDQKKKVYSRKVIGIPGSVIKVDQCELQVDTVERYQIPFELCSNGIAMESLLPLRQLPDDTYLVIANQVNIEDDLDFWKIVQRHEIKYQAILRYWPLMRFERF